LGRVFLLIPRLGCHWTFPWLLSFPSIGILKEQTRIEWAYCVEDFNDVFKANLCRSHILSPKGKWFYL
jgi:hypothetical protein